MGYAISVKFKTVDECQKMLDFLNSDLAKPVLEKIFPENSGCDLQMTIPFSWLCFGTGDSLSNYAPSSNKDKRISTKQTMISISLYHLFIWMANKSKYRDKNGKACFWYDDEKQVLIVNENIDVDGYYLISKPTGLLGIFTEILSERYKNYENQKPLLKQLDTLFNNFNMKNNKPSP